MFKNYSKCIVIALCSRRNIVCTNVIALFSVLLESCMCYFSSHVYVTKGNYILNNELSGHMLNDINPAGHAFPKFHEIASNEVQLLLQNMNTNKASGIDGISAKILKIAAPCISSSLTLIFNQSILTGVFPNDWKTSKVIPIYKSEAKDEMTNYRPISIISTVARIFERLIYNQIYEYLNNIS